jgi:hypothetical protein
MKVKNLISEGIKYSAIVLDEPSQKKLLSTLASFIPVGWKKFAHHMTVSFAKPLPKQEDLMKTFELTATEIGISDMAIAVKVSGYQSANKIPHITIAVNPQGGKPVMSNDITNWSPIQPIKLKGIATEVV